MNSGHGTEPASVRRSNDWVQAFLESHLDYEPGTCYCYNSYGTYVLSAAVQKRSGQKVVDYLDTRLWQPLGIEKPRWQESPAGINTGGWGLYLKTEDLARMGLCILNGGKFGGKQVIPADWVKQMTTRQVDCVPAGTRPEQAAERGLTVENSDWVQGYCYQMWRCRHNAVRADGASGQYIIVIPDKDAVVVVTASLNDMQKEINLIWDHIYPAL
jgi:CubicO group peptidase (beta-lactamase class C family)